MSTLVQSAAALAQPWADLYGGSAAIASTVAFMHFAGVMGAGGLALSADRNVLRLGRGPGPGRTAVVHELEGMHGWVIAGLAAVVASGILMLAADVEALLPSPVFWAKMAAFALLLVNGVLLRGAGRAAAAEPALADSPAPAAAAGADAAWRALRRASIRSVALWFAVLFLGTLLTAVA